MIKDGPENPHQALIRDLQGLGFSDYEAKAYIALFQYQPATAYEVSKAAGLPKANSYSVLEGLSKKDAVLPVSENPVRYMAVAPDILFDRIARATERRCERLKENLGKLPNEPQYEYVWSVNGADALAAKIEEIIDSAETHLWVKGAEAILEPHHAALARAAKRGVKILVILFGTDLKRFEFGPGSKTYLHEGNGIPTGIAPHLITMTRDFKEALVADHRSPARGSYTRNTPLVNMADTLIRHEVYFGEIFEAFGVEIQQAFGSALIELRRKYLPPEQVKVLESLLGSEAVPAEPKTKKRRTSKG